MMGTSIPTPRSSAERFIDFLEKGSNAEKERMASVFEMCTMKDALEFMISIEVSLRSQAGKSLAADFVKNNISPEIKGIIWPDLFPCEIECKNPCVFPMEKAKLVAVGG